MSMFQSQLLTVNSLSKYLNNMHLLSRTQITQQQPLELNQEPHSSSLVRPNSLRNKAKESLSKETHLRTSQWSISLVWSNYNNSRVTRAWSITHHLKLHFNRYSLLIRNPNQAATLASKRTSLQAKIAVAARRRRYRKSWIFLIT